MKSKISLLEMMFGNWLLSLRMSTWLEQSGFSRTKLMKMVTLQETSLVLLLRDSLKYNASTLMKPLIQWLFLNQSDFSWYCLRA